MKAKPPRLSDAKVKQAIAETRRRLLAQIKECKNQHLLALDIESAVKQGDMWQVMTAEQRKWAMIFVREIQGLDDETQSSK